MAAKEAACSTLHHCQASGTQMHNSTQTKTPGNDSTNNCHLMTFSTLVSDAKEAHHTTKRNNCQLRLCGTTWISSSDSKLFKRVW